MSVSDKARLLLKKGRVTIEDFNYNWIRAVVEGEHGTYRVEVLRDGRFNCECEHFIYSAKVECSHILAIKMHSIYRSWWPMILLEDNTIAEDSLLRSSMPFYSLEPLEFASKARLGVGAPISDDGEDEITAFIIRLRNGGKSYSEIARELKREYDMEVSQGYVYRRLTDNPNYSVRKNLSSGKASNDFTDLQE